MCQSETLLLIYTAQELCGQENRCVVILQPPAAGCTNSAGGSAVHNCSLTMCLTPIRDCRWITDLLLISWKRNGFIPHGNGENVICVAPCTALSAACLHEKLSYKFLTYFELLVYLHFILSFFAPCAFYTLKSPVMVEYWRLKIYAMTRAHIKHMQAQWCTHALVLIFPFTSISCFF